MEKHMRTLLRVAALVTLLSLTLIPEGFARGGGHSGFHFGGSSHTSNHYTHGYTRRDGTHVQGYHATNPNRTRNDNYSTRGNVNPYTGKLGTKPRDEALR
jgi:hypothetical protein